MVTASRTHTSKRKKVAGAGGSVSIDANRIIVGAYGDKLGSESVPTGAVYIFERSSNGNTWTQTARLVPQGARKGWMAPYGFGIEVAVEGDAIAVLAKDYSSLFSGVEAPVYLFRQSENGQWMQQLKVLPSTDFPDENGFFSVAVWDSRMVAGEIFAKNEQGVVGGAVHILDVPAENIQSLH